MGLGRGTGRPGPKELASVSCLTSRGTSVLRPVTGLRRATCRRTTTLPSGSQRSGANPGAVSSTERSLVPSALRRPAPCGRDIPNGIGGEPDPEQDRGSGQRGDRGGPRSHQRGPRRSGRTFRREATIGPNTGAGSIRMAARVQAALVHANLVAGGAIEDRVADLPRGSSRRASRSVLPTGAVREQDDREERYEGSVKPLRTSHRSAA
jgi:hypothetical protein